MTDSERNSEAIDSAYIQLLEGGMQILRESCGLGIYDWTRVEIEHLHNVPSLIRERNRLRHQYYFEVERANYLSAIESLRHERLLRLVNIFYSEPWSAIAGFLR